MSYPHRLSPTRSCDRGFTLIESALSMVIVGLMLVAALNTVGASKTSQYRNSERSLGPMLAEELMVEILSHDYEEPDDPVVFGRESESATIRTAWDDVDDYNGWTANPPQNADGTPVDGATGWERSVTVTRVTQGALTASGSDTGLKRVEVTVSHGGRPITTLTSLRSQTWPD